MFSHAFHIVAGLLRIILGKPITASKADQHTRLNLILLFLFLFLQGSTTSCKHNMDDLSLHKIVMADVRAST